MSLDLGIVLPTRNERDNLPSLVTRVEEALGREGWEIVVVDDDSPDGTADVARDLARSDPRVRVIQRFGRRGLASAAIEGMCATAAPFVAVMDADHQHDPALLPAMLAAVEAGECDVAVASRFVTGGSAAGLASETREKGSRLANRLARKVTGVELTDPMSGYFLLRADRLRAAAPRLSGIGFKILLDLLATADPPMRVKEFPLEFAARASGESKLDTAVAFEFLVGLYDRSFGRVIPSRFALFGTVGAVGVAVHMAVLWLLFRLAGEGFALATVFATFAAMTFNFWLNNRLTYRDARLVGGLAWLKGWAGFCATCSVGALANVATATLLEARGVFWVLAALAGIVIGSVWNYALSSCFVWGRY
ncbi:Undecaprenyl-phosphate mannosyltransferase [Tsuneonella dongtanensis]|uniref:Undecaprenyl-phosphate mannosyltransferase n=1 Tax=Tsuneonella dongtanensis TaxID=692370 RepID=A0A1B2AC80_9SPHN|nr:glycosyltransferase family 2 protein [Tsuneonella dongtanensis]ANY19772.1 Undecaprenyl-phosphate mannosyltransferase [Tsuneonella dongtanensis]